MLITQALGVAAMSDASGQAGFTKQAMNASNGGAAVAAAAAAANASAPGTSLTVTTNPSTGACSISGTVLGHDLPASDLHTHANAGEGGSDLLGYSSFTTDASGVPDPDGFDISINGDELERSPSSLAATLIHEALHLAFAADFPGFASDPACADCMEQLVSCTTVSSLCGMAQDCSLPLADREAHAAEANSENDACKDKESSHGGSGACATTVCSQAHPPVPPSSTTECTAAECQP